MPDRAHPDKFHEECGVVGVYGHPEAATLAYLSLYALQHRGQESAGIVASNGDAGNRSKNRRIEISLVPNIEELVSMPELKGEPSTAPTSPAGTPAASAPPQK